MRTSYNQCCYFLLNKMSEVVSISVLFVSDTRETGFVNAVIAAGITFQVTRACTKGELLGCSCAKRKKPKKFKVKATNPNQLPESDFKWGGCGENIEFGIKKSKVFLESIYKRSDMTTLVKLHNYMAGRLVSVHTLFSSLIPFICSLLFVGNFITLC